MLPRVLDPKNVKSADFIEKTTNITLEIKEPEGNGKNTISNQFRDQKEKAHNFIIDMRLSSMSNDDLFKYVENIYRSKHTDWVDTIVLLRDCELIKVYKKK